MEQTKTPDFDTLTLKQKAEHQESYKESRKKLIEWLNRYNEGGNKLSQVMVRTKYGSINTATMYIEDMPRLTDTLEYLVPMEIQARINTLTHWIDLLENG